MNDHDYLAKLRPERFPSPAFVADEARLRANVAILDQIQRRTGAKILLALKAFAMWSLFPLISRSPVAVVEPAVVEPSEGTNQTSGHGALYGCCASSPDEARLGREKFGGEVHAFAAAYSEGDMHELLATADHLVFNSFAQWERFRPLVQTRIASSAHPLRCGLRINPEHSEGAAAIYNPCAPGSRLGIRRRDFRPENLKGISGLHFHTLCEQDAGALERTLAAFESNFGTFLHDMEWVNFGGGHHITRPGYDVDLLCRCIERIRDTYHVQVYLEPGEAVALNAGVLVSTVLDVVEADMPVAILDTSAAAHMPDVLEMPYSPAILDAGEPGSRAWTCRMAGKSCLAGDVIGEYAFDSPLQVGDRVVFTDMAIYSMVKTTTFNGLRLPTILRWNPDTDVVRLVREFSYEDFKMRLS